MNVLTCPTCGHEAPLEDCDVRVETSDSHQGAELHWLHADCPLCGRYGVSYGKGGWDLPPVGATEKPDEWASGVCALCAEPAKVSHTRLFGPLLWTGWCDACRAVSHVARRRAPRAVIAPREDRPLAPLSPTWLDSDD